MHVGIVGGTGPLGRGLGVRLASAGVPVTIGSRDPDRAAHVVGELTGRWPDHHLPIQGAGNAVAAGADLVVVATPWDAVLSTVGPLREELSRKVVVSVANALVKQGREFHALVPPRGSMAAQVQATLPRSLVAAAAHHLPAAILADLGEPLAADVLVCSDHDAATAATLDLFRRVPGLRPLEAGTLASASAIEAFTAVLVTLNVRYKAHSTLRLAGVEDDRG